MRYLFIYLTSIFLLQNLPNQVIVTDKHFVKALANTKPSHSTAELIKYNKL